VPVINENDTVATNEIRYGDNDRLAARVATMASADLLVLLSDVDGLYDAPPGAGASARHVPEVERVTPEIEAMAGAAGSELSRGGMQTKIEAAKIAAGSGTHMVIASGRVQHPLDAIAKGARCTWFLTAGNPVTARKKWIAGSLEPKGTLTIDAGAVAGLRRGNSLLPVGVGRIEGDFARGDAVVIRGPDGTEIRIRYREGVLAPDGTSTSGDPLVKAAKAEKVFIELLAKYSGQNAYVSQREGKSYAPYVFAKDAAVEGVNKTALKAAMERLLEKGVIENAPYGAPSKNQFRLYVKSTVL